MGDFLDAKRTEIGARLAELKPLVDEYERLAAAAAALDGIPAARAPAPAAKRARRARAQSGTKRANSSSGGGQGRTKRTGTRADDALAIVRAEPGLKIREIAKKMGIQPNYLYRVLSGLTKRGLVNKDGDGWHPVEVG